MRVNATIQENKKQHGIEILFNSCPAAAARNELKVIGFKWNPKKKAWYIRATKQNRSAALDFIANYNAGKFYGPMFEKKAAETKSSMTTDDFLDCLAVIGF